MNPQILIVGAGAIGCLVGGKLAQSGQDVTLLGRARLMDAIRERGLIITNKDETIHVTNLATLTAPPDNAVYDLVIFTVKSYDTASAARAVAHTLTPQTLVLSLQNGVGNEEILQQGAWHFPPFADKLQCHAPSDNILAGTITISAQFTVENVLEMRTTKGGIGVAPTTASRERRARGKLVAEMFRAAGFNARVHADYKAMKWSKLLLNIIANATCAILDMTPAQIMADEQIFALERAAFREALAVMRAANIRPVSLIGYPVPLLAWLIDSLPLTLLKPMRPLVMGGRGGKMPSLHIDLTRRLGDTGARHFDLSLPCKGLSLPRKEKCRAPSAADVLSSEVVYLNGAVVKLAEQLNVAVPVNRAIYTTLSSIVRGGESWDAYRGKPEKLISNWQNAWGMV